MKHTNDDIEAPVAKSPWLLVLGIFVLILLLTLGIFLLIEAFKTPEGPQDVLDAKRMLASGAGLLFFAVAVSFFLIRMFRNTRKKAKTRAAAGRTSSSRKTGARKPATTRKQTTRSRN